jgi:hypothetical protein
MSIANSFVLLALLFAIFAGIVVFLLSRSIGAAVFATSLVMIGEGVAQILPYWMLLAYLVMAIGYVYITWRHQGS